MHIIKLSGGLGNQIFQYAFAKALASKTDRKVAFDISSYNRHKDRAFSLNDFQTDIPLASRNEIANVLFPSQLIMRMLSKISPFFWKYSKEIVTEKGQYVFDETLIEIPNTDKFYDGHWQNEKYFKDVAVSIRDGLRYSKPLDEVNTKTLSDIENTLSVSLHIRRGDYLNISTVGEICDIPYYIRALEYVSSKLQNPIFFVFSDDIPWAKANLPSGYKYQFIESNTAHPPIDLHLMSHCKHHIIANSTFSWWGAWLNPDLNKIVVAPKLWHRIYTDADIVPPEWVRI